MIGNDVDFRDITKAYPHKAFEQNIRDAITAGVLAPILAEFDLAALAQAIKTERDLYLIISACKRLPIVISRAMRTPGVFLKRRRHFDACGDGYRSKRKRKEKKR